MPVYYPPSIGSLDVHLPTIFLAGPIQGAPKWQEEVIKVFSEKFYNNINIACPRSPGPWHGDYEAQVKWETFHLQLAASSGLILFWVPLAEEEHPDRCYGQTTRFELAEWITKYKSAVDNNISKIDSPKLIIGIDPLFSGRRYIVERTKGYLNINFSQQETVQKASELISALISRKNYLAALHKYMEGEKKSGKTEILLPACECSFNHCKSI